MGVSRVNLGAEKRWKRWQGACILLESWDWE